MDCVKVEPANSVERKQSIQEGSSQVPQYSSEKLRLTLFPRGCRFRPTPGGVSDTPPPLEIKEGVVLGPMLLYRVSQKK